MKRSRVDTESMAPTSFRCSFSPFLTQHSHFVIKFRFTFSYYRYPMSQKTASDSDSEDNDCKLCRNTFFWTSEFMEKFIGTKKKYLSSILNIQNHLNSPDPQKQHTWAVTPRLNNRVPNDPEHWIHPIMC